MTLPAAQLSLLAQRAGFELVGFRAEPIPAQVLCDWLEAATTPTWTGWPSGWGSLDDGCRAPAR